MPTKKRFFRTSNQLLRDATAVIKQLYGTNEEKLGQFEMIVKSEGYQRKYPGFIGKDVASIVRMQLGKYGIFI